jgi:hypothetical protein
MVVLWAAAEAIDDRRRGEPMAAPTQGVLDNFNRANGGLGANWTAGLYSGTTAPTIISNTAGISAGALFHEVHWNAASYTESEVYATIATPPATGQYVYVWARGQSLGTTGADGYQLLIERSAGTDAWTLSRVIDEVETALATRSQEVSAGDAFGLVVLGTGATVTLQIWYRANGGSWTQLGADVSDTSGSRIIAAGRIGFGFNANTTRVDDFGGGEQTAAGTYTGSGDLVIPALTMAGTGTFTAPVSTGSGDLAIPALTLAGTGAFADPETPTYTGSGDLVIPALTADGAGTFTPPVSTGTGDLAIPALTLAGAGTFTPPTYTGSGNLIMPALTMAGTGVRLEAGGHLRFYGTASGRIDRVRIPLRNGGSPTAVDVGAGDCTYECWLRCAYADNTTANISDARYSNIFFDRDAWNSTRGHVIGVTRVGGVLVVCFAVAGAGLTWTTQYGTANVGDGQPHHVALVRQQSTGVIELYVDGVLDASGTYTTGDLRYDGTDAGGQDNDAIILGTEKHDVGAGFAGRFDALRISDHRRYTTTFSPARELSVDAHTVGLYQFDDAVGTIATDDASGVHGVLLVGGANNGPTWQAPDLAPFTGTGDLTIPALTLAGTGTFVPPGAETYTGSGDLAIPALTISGTGTFVAPVYTGTGDLAIPALTMAGAGTFVAPTYTGTGDLVAPALTISGTGTFVAPISTGSGDLITPALTMAGAGTFTAPVYTGIGNLDMSAFVLSGTGTFTSAGTGTGSGNLVLPAITLAGTGTFTAPTVVSLAGTLAVARQPPTLSVTRQPPTIVIKRSLE